MKEKIAWSFLIVTCKSHSAMQTIEQDMIFDQTSQRQYGEFGTLLFALLS